MAAGIATPKTKRKAKMTKSFEPSRASNVGDLIFVETEDFPEGRHFQVTSLEDFKGARIISAGSLQVWV
jgi:hypothetical protein